MSHKSTSPPQTPTQILLSLIEDFGAKELAELLKTSPEKLLSIQEEDELPKEFYSTLYDLSGEEVLSPTVRSENDPDKGSALKEIPKNTEAVPVNTITQSSAEEFINLTTKERALVRAASAKDYLSQIEPDKDVAKLVGIPKRTVNAILNGTTTFMRNNLCMKFFLLTKDYVFLKTKQETHQVKEPRDTWPALETYIEKTQEGKEVFLAGSQEPEGVVVKKKENVQENNPPPKVTTEDALERPEDIEVFRLMDSDTREKIRLQLFHTLLKTKTKAEVGNILGCNADTVRRAETKKTKLGNFMCYKMWRHTTDFVFLKTQEEKSLQRAMPQKTITVPWPDLDTYVEPTEVQNQEVQNRHHEEQTARSTEDTVTPIFSQELYQKTLVAWIQEQGTKAAATKRLGIAPRTLQKSLGEQKRLPPHADHKLYQILGDTVFLWTKEEKEAYPLPSKIPPEDAWPTRYTETQESTTVEVTKKGVANTESTEQISTPENKKLVEITEDSPSNAPQLNDTEHVILRKKTIPKMREITRERLPTTENVAHPEMVNVTFLQHLQTPEMQYQIGHIATSVNLLLQSPDLQAYFGTQLRKLGPRKVQAAVVEKINVTQFLDETKKFLAQALEDQDMSLATAIVDEYLEVITTNNAHKDENNKHLIGRHATETITALLPLVLDKTQLPKTAEQNTSHLTKKENVLEVVSNVLDNAKLHKDIEVFESLCTLFTNTLKDISLAEDGDQKTVRFRRVLRETIMKIFVSAKILELDFPTDFQDFVEESLILVDMK